LGVVRVLFPQSPTQSVEAWSPNGGVDSYK